MIKKAAFLMLIIILCALNFAVVGALDAAPVGVHDWGNRDFTPFLYFTETTSITPNPFGVVAAPNDD